MFRDPFDTVQMRGNRRRIFDIPVNAVTGIRGRVLIRTSGAGMNAVSENFDNLIAQLKNFQIPGLIVREELFSGLRDVLCKDIAVFLYKQERPLIWAVVTGGTGTGKSTLFNMLCGSYISKAGMERPTTEVPVVYLHKKKSLDEFPFPDFHIEYAQDREDAQINTTGKERRLIVVEHNRDNLEHIALVDNPDLDSLKLENRQIADDMYRLADVIIFVTSQEKYADEIPVRTLDRVIREGKPYFFLFNKADPAHTPSEIVDFFQERGIVINRKQLWCIPYIPSPSLDSLAAQDEFIRFSTRFFETVRKDTSTAFLIEQKRQRLAHLTHFIDSFCALAESENKAGEQWLERLNQLFKGKGSHLFEQFEAHFKNDSHNHIQREIKNIYNRYDILSKPRHYLKQVMLVPLRLLGLREKDRDSTSRKDLRSIQKQADITPILSTMNSLNRLVLETLSPEDNISPFFRALHRDEMALSDQEIREKIGQLHARLIEWLEGTFRKLARGIPIHKEVGIYSTTIIWGGLILSFEIVLGGGITFIEMALDSFLAPLVTKGSVNLFAFHEIQGIARELDKRYKEGILDILEEQKQRYVSCLEPFLIPDEMIEKLQDLKTKLGD